jgi:hypothetical protein
LRDLRIVMSISGRPEIDAVARADDGASDLTHPIGGIACFIG